MGNLRTVKVPDGYDGETKEVEMTNLEWSLQYVLLKIQDMVLSYAYIVAKPSLLSQYQIFHNRKTDQCGVILFGTEGDMHTIFYSSSS